MNTNDQIEKTKRGYHFTGSALRNGDKIPAIGEWISVDGPIIPCESGLHMSEHPFDALRYAPGCMLHLVEIRGELQSHGAPIDKWVGRERRIIATIDASDMLRAFARWSALQVSHLWGCPEIVMRWLTTGDESIKSEAESEAWSASRSASLSASRSAAWSASWSAASSSMYASLSASWAAASSVSRYASLSASWSAASSASRSASLSASRSAACSSMYEAESSALSVSRSAQREKLQQMVADAFALKELEK